MEIVEFEHAGDKKEHWLEEIKRSDWRAGRYLYELLRDNRLKECYGERTRALLLTDGDALAAFCTYAERDDILDTALTPWIGFVYTFPEHRGKRRMGKLLEHVYALAKRDGYEWIYISTREEGLYEKYGCVFWKTMKDIHGEDSDVFRMKIDRMDYSGVLGRTVSGTIDRPLGSAYPGYPDMICPVNCGYADGVTGGDGAEQDVYVLGIPEPVKTFTGTVAAVLHRLNEGEDKWIVTADGARPGREEILRAVAFREQYYMGELYTI